MPHQTISAHLPYVSNDSQLNLPHTRNCGLGVFTVATATTPPKMPIFLQSVQKPMLKTLPPEYNALQKKHKR